MSGVRKEINYSEPCSNATDKAQLSLGCTHLLCSLVHKWVQPKLNCFIWRIWAPFWIIYFWNWPPSVQDTKGKEGRTKSNSTTIKTLQADSHFTRTYMQRHTMTEIVNHSSSTALELSVKLGVGGGGWGLIDFKWPQPSPLVLPCIHKTFVQSKWSSEKCFTTKPYCNR